MNEKPRRDRIVEKEEEYIHSIARDYYYDK